MFAFLTENLSHIDDFCNGFDSDYQHFFLNSATTKRRRACTLSLSEVMTIVVLFHTSGYRTFKDFYLVCVCRELKPYFPKALSYSRFVQVMEHARHRKPTNAFINLISGLIAYSFKPRKPSIKYNKLPRNFIMLTSN